MYSEEEKKTLMKELKEMESLKVDTGSEGEILQNDIIDFITEGNGDKYDLISRIELFTYAFKLFSRKEVTLSDNQFIVYLNDEVGGIKLVTRTSHFEKAVREARISYEKLNGYSSEKKAIMVY